MFENIKLKYYRDRIVGMAYSIDPGDSMTYNLTTYLVISVDDLYSFVQFKRGHIVNSQLSVNETIKHFESIGYKSLTHYAELNKGNKVLSLNKNIVK